MPASEPDELISLFSRYLTAGDVERAGDLYEPESLYMQPPGPVLGGTAICDALRDLVVRHPRMEGEPKQIYRVGDLALIFNQWKFESTRRNGTTSARTGVSTVVARQQRDNSWRIVIDDPWGGTRFSHVGTS